MVDELDKARAKHLIARMRWVRAFENYHGSSAASRISHEEYTERLNELTTAISKLEILERKATKVILG